LGGIYKVFKIGEINFLGGKTGNTQCALLIWGMNASEYMVMVCFSWMRTVSRLVATCTSIGPQSAPLSNCLAIDRQMRLFAFRRKIPSVVGPLTYRTRSNSYKHGSEDMLIQKIPLQSYFYLGLGYISLYLLLSVSLSSLSLSPLCVSLFSLFLSPPSSIVILKETKSWMAISSAILFSQCEIYIPPSKGNHAEAFPTPARPKR